MNLPSKLSEFLRGHIEVKKYEGWLSPIPGVGLKATWMEWWWGSLLVYRRVCYFENGKWHKGGAESSDALYGEEIMEPKGCLRVRCERRWKDAGVAQFGRAAHS